MVSQENIDASAGMGGEGDQIIYTIAISPEQDYMIMGTNTGGVFRREKKEGEWCPREPCNGGFDSRGGGVFAIDPYSPNRIIGLGVSASKQNDHGFIYQWINHLRHCISPTMIESPPINLKNILLMFNFKNDIRKISQCIKRRK